MSLAKFDSLLQFSTMIKYENIKVIIDIKMEIALITITKLLNVEFSIIFHSKKNKCFFPLI